MEDRVSKSKPRRMPRANDVWVTLEGPDDEYRANLEEQGIEVLSFEGWKIKVKGHRITREWSQHLQRAQRRIRLSVKLQDAMAERDAVRKKAAEAEAAGEVDEAKTLAESIEDIDPLSEDEWEFMFESADEDLWPLRNEVVDWDFVDYEGEEIPYSVEAWDQIPDQLIAACNRAIEARGRPGKAS